jgi:hypothetical protein
MNIDASHRDSNVLIKNSFKFIKQPGNLTQKTLQQFFFLENLRHFRTQNIAIIAIRMQYRVFESWFYDA